jgi:hypothetical protein
MGTGSALLLGIFVFGSAQATACDWTRWLGVVPCLHTAPVYGYYAGPSYTDYEPAPA